MKKLNSNNIALIIAPLIVVGLFTFMGVLIFQDPNLKKPDSKNINVSFLRNYREREVEDLSRKKPEKPKEPNKAPDAPVVNVNKPQQQQQLMQMETFAQSFDASSVGTGIAAGGGGYANADENSTLIAMVSVQPELPTRARIEGITGSVTVVFDVNEQGFVENARVVKSKPSQLFDQSVIRALYSSRFRPKKVDGKAISVRGNMRTYNLGF